MTTPKPTVAELIGETPEVMRLCGQILQLEHERANGKWRRDTYRVKVFHLQKRIRSLHEKRPHQHVESCFVTGEWWEAGMVCNG